MESRNKCAGVYDQASRLAVNRALHCKRAVFLSTQRHPREFRRRRDSTEVHLAHWINLEENEPGLAINHRFVAEQNVQTENTVNATVSGVGAL